jgi:Sulfotransferase family
VRKDNLIARSVICHFHIFKNAGTTIDWVLKRNFGRGWADFHGPHPESVLSPGEVAQFLTTHSSIIALSSHHVRFPLPKSEDFSLLPIIFIRHPVDRALSVYHFMRKQPGEFQRLGIPESATLGDYVGMRSHTGTEIGNWQTFFLSHDTNLREHERTVTNEDLVLAKQRIASATIIGVVDEFEDSIVVAEDILQRYFCVDMAYTAQNVCPSRHSEISDWLSYANTHLRPELLHDLIEVNSFDVELYEFTKKELGRRKKQIPDFELRLSALRARCSRLISV